jgi:hypothetical protein
VDHGKDPQLRQLFEECFQRQSVVDSHEQKSYCKSICHEEVGISGQGETVLGREGKKKKKEKVRERKEERQARKGSGPS